MDEGNAHQEITLEVDGRPPPKSEAKSVFAQGGKYEERVKRLLRAAKAEIDRGFDGFGSDRVRLEVEVRTGRGEPPWDATNYLGGITDVLESKSKRNIAQPDSLTHLAELADVGLYADDRQIKEILYREVDAEESSYLVTITSLERRKDDGGG